MKRNKRAFTLIELLVVVLIIGILSAIALPQYQKAVEKARATNLLALLKPIAQAVRVYELNNNSFPDTLDELDISLSTEQKTKYLCSNIFSCDDKDYGIILYNSGEGLRGVLALHMSGKYHGAGFAVFAESPAKYLIQADTLYCYERSGGGNTDFGLHAGDYCQKLFGGTPITSFTSNARLYSLP